MIQKGPVLITGATGYVGGRLVQILLRAGYRVRAGARSIRKIKARPWGNEPNLDPVRLDMLNYDSVLRAARGCFAAYYLISPWDESDKEFAELDKIAANNMVKSAEAAGLERIIYLGHLVGKDHRFGKYHNSRSEVVDILASGRAPVTLLWAGMIIGSGSASFEILRYLVDRTPVIILPKWVNTSCQPICIRNVLIYLFRCLENNETIGRAYDIGGPDIISYADLFQLYAEQAGLKRRIIVPAGFPSVRLNSYFLSLVVPAPVSVTNKFVDNMRNEMVCMENHIRGIIPQYLMTCREAFARALEKVEQNIVDTSCYDSGLALPPEWSYTGDVSYSGGTVLALSYKVRIQASHEQVWTAVKGVGGEAGWFFGGFLWKMRGFIDKVFGGVGMKRGRRHPVDIAVGDALDFWRVIAVEPMVRLQLHAEMRLPGDGLLEFFLKPFTDKETELTMVIRYLPVGLKGLLYWYSVYPLHNIIFKGMLKNIAKSCNGAVTYGPRRI